MPSNDEGGVLVLVKGVLLVSSEGLATQRLATTN